MKKKTLTIILCVLAVVLLLCLLPLPTTRTATLTAVKLDEDGKEAGTVQIPIEYTLRGPIFRKEPESVSMYELEGISKIENAPLERTMYEDYYSVTSGGGGLEGDVDSLIDSMMKGEPLESYSFQFIIHTDGDADRWLLWVMHSEMEAYTYVGSRSGKYSTEELLEYFEWTRFSWNV